MRGLQQASTSGLVDEYFLKKISGWVCISNEG